MHTHVNACVDTTHHPHTRARAHTHTHTQAINLQQEREIPDGDRL